MKKIKYIGFIIIILLPVAIYSQGESPIPVFEKEIREGTSIRMRSTELERIKREANKVDTGESNIERKIKFSAIKKDFEAIQKIQDSIIKTYTTGKKINYSKIGEKAEAMTKNALRLDENLFGAKSDTTIKKQEEWPDTKQKSVKNLIIELDKMIGTFVANPMFKNIKIVDLKLSKNAQSDLMKIIDLSRNLSNLAAKMK
jgi:hypothetical protein